MRKIFKLILAVLVIVIISFAVGGNGCVWTNNADTGSSESPVGTEGVNRAVSPSPANGVAGVATTVELSWASVAGMTSYDVCLDVVNPPSYLGTVPNTAYRSGFVPGASLQYNTTYYWRINARRNAAVYTGYVWSFKTEAALPVITGPYPANSSTNIPITTALAWNPVSGTTMYDVYLGISSRPMYLTSINQTTFIPASNSLAWGQVYYWRVRARSEAGLIIAVGDIWNFQTAAAVAPAVSPNPADGACDCPINTQLSWTSNSSAASYLVYFGVTITNWAPVTVTRTLLRTRYNPGALANNTKYYWQINAVDNLGHSVAGYIWTLTTIQAAPAVAANPNPADRTVNLSMTNTILSWSPSAYTQSYDVYFGATSSGAPIYRINTVLSSYNCGLLQYKTPYQWKVNARSGVRVTAGAIWSFTTAAPALPAKASGPSPTNNSANWPINFGISWLTGPEADECGVCFGATNPPPFVITKTKAAFRTTYNPGSLAYDTTYYWRINIGNSSGFTIGDVWRFRAAIPFPAQAGSENPVSGTANCPVTQTLRWGPALRAASYDVYLGLSADLGVADLLTNTVATSCVVSGLAYSTIYYWRINPRNTTGVTSGLVWNFQTLTAPDPVITVSPADNALGISRTIALVWNSAARAEAYDVYIDVMSPPVQLAGQTSQTSFSPELQWSSTYFWRVNARNGAGIIAGAVQKFSTMTSPNIVAAPPLSPLDGAVDVYLNAVFSWSPAIGAQSYNFYLGTTNPPTYAGNTSETSFAPPTLASNTHYFWQVNSLNEAVAPDGVAGPIWSFTTIAMPSAPALLWPDNNLSDVHITATLSWTAAANAELYRVYLGISAMPSYLQNTLNTNCIFNVLPNTRYYWQIGAANNAGESRSSVWSFTTLPLPGKVTNMTPAVSSTGLLMPVTLSWTGGLQADSYNIYVGLGNPPGFVVNQSGLTYQPELEYNRLYYWRVDSVNTSGISAGDVWSFSTLFSPDQALGPVPANLTIDVLNNQQLSWTAPPRTDNYDVYLGVDSPALMTLVSSGQSLTTFDPGELVYSRTYFWRIDSGNTAGKTTGDVWQFSTLMLPALAGGPAPADNAIDVSNSQLSWAAASRAWSYDVYFGTTATPGFLLNTVNTYFSAGAFSWGTQYFWQVNSRNPVGIATGVVWSFTTMNLPAQVTLLVPANNALNVSITQTLSWSAALRATSYDIYIGPQWQGLPASPVANVSGTSYSPSLSNGVVYSWRIDARNAAGAVVSGIWIFSTVPSLGPYAITNSATFVDTQSVILSGNVNPRGLNSSYYFEYGQVSYTNTTALQWTGNGVAFLPVSVTVTGLTPNTNYICRLIAANVNGTTYGSPQTFRTSLLWIKIAAGRSHTLALKNNGTLWVWGYNYYGELGLGDTDNRISPTQVAPGSLWRDIACNNSSHSLAIKIDGTLWAWGSNFNGQLGTGITGGTFSLPVQVGAGNDWAKIAAGDDSSFGGHSLATKLDGTIWTWGANSFGQLGKGNTTSSSTPAQIGIDTDWQQIAAGFRYSLAIKGGRLYGWGRSSDSSAYSALGIGSNYSSNSAVPTPTAAIVAYADFVEVRAGFAGGLARRANGTIWAWGDNRFQQTGLGANAYVPTQIGGALDWAAIGFNSRHGAAIKNNGTLWTWGENQSGELGQGVSGTPVPAPAQVGSDADWSMVTNGGDWTVSNAFTIMLKSDGTMWSCGSNGNAASGIFGQLGLGYNDDRNILSPARIQ